LAVREYTSCVATTREHLEALLRLSPEERSQIAEALLESLDEGEQDADAIQAWAEEIVKRVERNAPGIPAEQVFAEGRARLTSRE
jgi:putative addiction module component (TIGR02574 family)